MKDYIVSTDSGCDLPAKLLEEKGIIPFGLFYEIGGELFEDTMKDSDIVGFYEKMRNGAVPKTSQGTQSQFEAFFTSLLGQSKTIVYISLGSAVSGSYASAAAAAREVEKANPESRIFVVDSTLCSTGYGMLALKAAELRDKGVSVEECVAEIERLKITVNTWYTTDELLYLRRSGRCSRASQVVGTILKICPILNLDAEGHLIVQERVRGIEKTIARIHSIIKQNVVDATNQTLYICHSTTPEKAREFGEGLRADVGFRDVFYTYIGAIIGSNCGPGLRAAFYFGKPRTMDGYSGK